MKSVCHYNAVETVDTNRKKIVSPPWLRVDRHRSFENKEILEQTLFGVTIDNMPWLSLGYELNKPHTVPRCGVVAALSEIPRVGGKRVRRSGCEAQCSIGQQAGGKVG